ncbi:hypothetical protein [Jeotgalibacillus sp. R-1-5s-1]|uniref:hypothetical protein n=1 Tax=Jeotgalibacillus sp. R-1-5s-1 TaxID=2555897 RepID=UPI00106C35FB|nr:hypothetical protein [Jeotgalibacillus sp. R-1-5s-1]TFE02456.1 hypothetical protein E2491_02625 [Jeotgalibacillus sp. R-1-5s-1]
MVAVITLLPVIMIGLILVFFMTRNKSFRRQTSRIPLKYMLSAYVGILLLSLVTYYMIGQSEEVAGREIESSVESEDFDLHQKIFNRQFDEIDDKYYFGQEKIGLDSDELSIRFADQNMDTYSYNIVVTKDPDVKGEIIIDYYRVPFSINGIDISEEFEAADMRYDNGEIIVNNLTRDYVNLEFAEFQMPIPGSQFSDDRSNRDWNFNFQSGGDFYHIQIPENTQLNYDPNVPIYEFEN